MCAQAALAAGNASAKSTGLHSQLQQSWSQRCSLVRHNQSGAEDAGELGEGDQEKAEELEKLDPNLFKPSLCYKTGFCVCQNTPGRNSIASVYFQESLVKRLKPLCWSKDKKKSEARLLLEKAGMVLALRSQPAGMDLNGPQGHDLRPAILYLHVGFVNFQSWKMTVLPLRPLEHVASRHAQRIELGTLNLHEQFIHDPAPDHFQLSTNFFRDNIDFDQQCSVRLYSIDDDWTKVLTEEESKSGYVTITKYSQEFTVWLGFAEEAANRRQKRKRSTGARPKPSSDRKRPRAPNKSRQPLPRVVGILDQIDAEQDGLDVLDAIDFDAIDVEHPNPGDSDTGMDVDQSNQSGFDSEDASAHSDTGESQDEDQLEPDNDDDELLQLLNQLVDPEALSDEEYMENLVDAVELMDDGRQDHFYIVVLIGDTKGNQDR